MSKWKSSKAHHFRRFQPKRTSPSFSAHFLTYYNTGQKIFSTFFRIWHCLDIRIIKNYIKLMFWRLGTMLERLFKAKSFGLRRPKFGAQGVSKNYPERRAHHDVSVPNTILQLVAVRSVGNRLEHLSVKALLYLYWLCSFLKVLCSIENVLDYNNSEDFMGLVLP